MSRNWTPKMEDDLIANYDGDRHKWAEKYNTTPCAISWKVHRLKTHGKSKIRAYSIEEEQFLIDNWNKITMEEMSEKLGFDIASLEKKACALRRRGHNLPFYRNRDTRRIWSREEELDLLNNYDGKNANYFMEKYGVRKKQVQSKAAKLRNDGMKIGERKDYTTEEIQYIVSNWNILKPKDIAAHFNTNVVRICGVVSKLRLVGYDIPKCKINQAGAPGHPIGTVMKRANGTIVENNADGWKTIPKPKKVKEPKEPKEPKAPKEPQPKAPKEPKSKVLKPVKIKAKADINDFIPKKRLVQIKDEPKLQIKFKSEGKRLVQVDKKTWKYINI